MMEETPCDFLACALEEIALEGLDGITLPTLWVRLLNRPHFPIAVDEDSKKFIWGCVAVHHDIEIYQLPISRPTIELHNRYDIIDPELGIFMEPKCIQQDIYPIAIVDDGKYRGSCATYKTRLNITSKIRHSNMLLVSLNQALSEWGNHLVLVSSPNSRLIALIGTEVNPLLEMRKEAYAVLERIGRSRYHGEVSHGQLGLLSLKCENLNYIISKLHVKGLVTKQKHYLKKNDGRCVTGYLYHLTNFFVRRKTKFESLMEMMNENLKDKPHKRELSKVLRKELGWNQATFKKVIHRSNQKWFQFAEVSYAEMFPESSLEERLTSSGHEKVAKVVRMVQPFDADEEPPDRNIESNVMDAYFDQSKVSIDKPILCQVYSIIERAGHQGLTLKEIVRALTIPRLDVRQLCRHLHKVNDVITIMIDHGRQRSEKYICKKFENQSECCMKFKEQVEKLKKHNSNLVVQNSDEKLPEPNKTVLPKPHDSNDDDDDGGPPKKKAKLSKGSHFMNLNTSTLLDMQSEVFKTGKTDGKSIRASQVTARTLKRCNMVIEYINKCKIATFYDLHCNLCAREQDEGHTYKLDKKSLLRLLTKLSKEGHIKIMKTTLKQGKREKEVELVCDSSVESNNDMLQRAIEQAKFKFFGSGENETKSKASPMVTKDVNAHRPKKTKPPPSEISLSLKNFKSISAVRKMYGLLPKFVRAKTLHLFLFYLVYKYEGIGGKDTKDPFKHHDSESWKRYVPPLPDSDKQGWCILSDVIPRLPLSIFIKIVNMMHEIPNLHDYLDDPDKQHYLLKYLPTDLRSTLLDGRRFVFRIFDVVHTLCQMGLVSFGPKIPVKEKEQTYLYVHRRINIKDTTVSSSGYIFIDRNISYEMKEYFLESITDVETFWLDLETICTLTPLGRWSMMEQNDKPSDISAVMETCQNKQFNEIQDTGVIPGDGLGAAGLNSSLFGHLRRNWCWMSQSLKPPQEKIKAPSITSMTLQKLLENSHKDHHSENRKRLRCLKKIPLDPHKIQTGNHVKELECTTSTKEPSAKKIRIHKPKVYKIRKLKPHVRQPYYDEKDKAALKLMEKCRIDWTDQEDSFLLVCKVTSVFLDPKFKRVVVPFTVIRDLLHEQFPRLSANKTSRACQRRLRYILLNTDTRNSVAAFLGEAMQDSELVKYCNIPKLPKSNQESWKNMFVDLFHKLLEKVSSKPSTREAAVILPKNMKLLEEQYKILCPKLNLDSGFKHLDPKSLQEIYREVIHGLVTLALASVSSQQNWSYELYKLYDQYPEMMIKTILDELTKEYLITKTFKRRNNQPRLSVPRRFTVFYENSFITKYPVSTYSEARDFLGQLTPGSASNEIQLSGDAPMGYAPVLLAFELMKQVEFNVRISDLLVTFRSLLNKRHPNAEQMKPFGNTNDSQQFVKLCNGTRKSEDADQHEFVEKRTKRIKLSNSVSSDLLAVSATESTEEPNDEIMDQQGTEKEPVQIVNNSAETDNVKNAVHENSELASNEPSNGVNVCSTSRLDLNMLRQENVSKNDQPENARNCFALNPCRISCHIEAHPDDDSHRLVMNPKELVFETEQRIAAGSYLVGKQYTLNEQMVNDIIIDYSSNVPQDLLALTDFSDILNRIYEKYSSKIKADGERIFSRICEAEVYGVSHKELWIQFKDLSSLSVLDHLTLLLQSMLVLWVGSVCFRYVCVKYSKPWLLTSFRTSRQRLKQPVNIENDSLFIEQHLNAKCKQSEIKDVLDSIINECENKFLSSDNSTSINDIAKPSVSDKFSDHAATERKSTESVNRRNNERCLNNDQATPIYFLPRIWRMPNGSINKLSLMKYLHSILGYIMTMPGVSEEKICKRFSLLLPPIQTLELLQLLFRLNCVFKYSVKCVKSKSIFASVSDIFITELGPEDEVHYESFADAILKISHFESQVTSNPFI